MTLSLPPQYKLLSKEEFQFVFAKANKVKRKHFLALHRPNQRPYARLGMVIAKQRLKRAVDRNLLRRIIRESFRAQKESLKGLDIIVLLRSECTPLGKKDLRDDVDNLWHGLLDK